MKILVVKLADLGDLLISEPALRSLRLGFPKARIDVLTTPHAAVLLPDIAPGAHALTFEKASFDAPGLGAAASLRSAASLGARLRAAGYDRVVLLHHLTTTWGMTKYRALARATGASMIVGLDNGRGAFLTHRAPDRGFGYKHEAEYMLDVAVAAGGKPTHAIPVFNADQSPLPFDLPGSFVAVAPVAGAYSPARIWPAGKFADLCRQLADRGIKFVIVGGSDATPAARTILNGIDRCAGIDLTGKTTIGQLAATLKRASAVIGNDSFPTHLGAAVGTPVTTIFGPSNSRAWKPLSRHSTVVSAGLPCAPCLYTGYRLGRPDGCPSRTCLEMVTPEMVSTAVLEQLDA